MILWIWLCCVWQIIIRYEAEINLFTEGNHYFQGDYTYDHYTIKQFELILFFSSIVLDVDRSSTNLLHCERVKGFFAKHNRRLKVNGGLSTNHARDGRSILLGCSGHLLWKHFYDFWYALRIFKRYWIRLSSRAFDMLIYLIFIVLYPTFVFFHP